MGVIESPVAGSGAIAMCVEYTEPLVGALQSLYRAYQKTSIYPLGHPAIPEALAWAEHEFEPILDDRPSILIGVVRDRLVVDDVALCESTGALSSFASLLHDLDIAAIEFRSGLSADELQLLIEALGECRRECVLGSAVVDALARKGADHINAIPIDYSALQFSEGARTPSSSDGTPSVWSQMFSVLTDPSVLAGDRSAEQLARQVSLEIERNEGTGINGLRRRIRGLSGKIDRLSPEERGALRERLREFLTELNPDLRRDLLRVDTRGGDDNLSTLTNLADVVPETDLLDALQEIDRGGSRVPDQVLTLMNKLVRISNDRPSLASGLEDVLTKWGVSSSSGARGVEGKRPALEEIFQRRGDVAPNPESYQALLDELSTAVISTPQRRFDSKYRDPRDRDDVRLHAAEIAVMVVGKPSGDEFRAGLFGYIEANSARLLKDRRFDSLRDSAVVARSYSILREQREETRRAASRFLDEYTHERRIVEILKNSCEGPDFPEAAASLLGLGGDLALDRVLDFLDMTRPVKVRRRLTKFVVDAGPDRLAERIEERWVDGWPLLKPIFEVLRAFPAADSVRLLGRLARHSEARVRREAILMLCEFDRRPNALERHLKQALGDSDPRLVAIAIFRLSRHGTSRSIDILGRFICGRLGETSPSLGMVARAARTLPACREPGLDALCSCLESIYWSLWPDKICRGLIVAQVLEEHVSSPAVAACLIRWQRSPAKGMLRLFPGIQRRIDGRKAG